MRAIRVTAVDGQREGETFTIIETPRGIMLLWSGRDGVRLGRYSKTFVRSGEGARARDVFFRFLRECAPFVLEEFCKKGN